MPNNKDFFKGVFSWLMTDRLKLIKICIPVAIIVLLGVYYIRNLVLVVNSPESIKHLFEKGPPFPICLKYHTIHHEDGMFFIRLSGTKIELRNLPNSIKDNLNSRYSIQAEMVEGMVLEVKKARPNQPRIYKIIFSGLTTLIVCSLFFLFFRYSNKGFVWN